MEKINFRIPLLGAIALYLFSLFLPVYSGVGAMGWLAVVGGWMVGANDIPSAIAWFANVTFIYSVILILKRKNPKPLKTVVVSVLSLIFGLVVFAAGMSFAGSSEFMAKASMGTGFYVWILSFVLMILAAWIKFKKR